MINMYFRVDNLAMFIDLFESSVFHIYTFNLHGCPVVLLFFVQLRKCPLCMSYVVYHAIYPSLSLAFHNKNPWFETSFEYSLISQAALGEAVNCC